MRRRQRRVQPLGRFASPATHRMRVLASSRPTRRAALRRMLAALMALGVLGVTAIGAERAQDTRDRWESTVEVLVARHDLEVGSSVDAASLRRESRPTDLVPDGALLEAPPRGSVATAAILAGETLVEARIAGPDDTRTKVPTGRVALDIELTRAAPGIGVGDHVGVLTTGADGLVGPDVGGTGAPGDGGTRPVPGGATPRAFEVAADAIVLARVQPDRDTVLTVAVNEHDLASTAAAAIHGQLVVVKRNPGD